MGLYKSAEWFEQNIKNINELHHWNCLTVKQFQFTKTQEFSFAVKILLRREYGILYINRMVWTEHWKYEWVKPLKLYYSQAISIYEDL